MGKSNEMFLEMREDEMAQIYRADFTKKHAQAKGKELAVKILEEGLISKKDAFVNLIRHCEVVNTAKDTLKESLPLEKFTYLGVEIAPMNGRKILQYQEDPLWCEISNQLKKREELLKVALNSVEPIFTEEGEVPKVSVTYAKDSINVKF
jgi:hypothetical protein